MRYSLYPIVAPSRILELGAARPARSAEPNEKHKTVSIKRLINSEEKQVLNPRTASAKAMTIGFGTLAAVLVALVMPAQAHGSSGSSIIETIGISTAVGTVIGASTLPFYEEPGEHARNLYFGAAIGAGVGLGILIHRWISGPSDDGRREVRSTGDKNRRETQLSNVDSSLTGTERPGWSRVASGSSPIRATVPRSPAFWMPVVSLHL